MSARDPIDLADDILEQAVLRARSRRARTKDAEQAAEFVNALTYLANDYGVSVQAILIKTPSGRIASFTPACAEALRDPLIAEGRHE